MTDKSLTGVVTWLKQWFYDKSEIDTNKQDKLVSGTNIKTINGNDILGNGNLTIQGGSGSSAIACVSDMGLDGTDLFLDACNGKVIESITKTTNGLVDTYTITYDDDSTYQFTVTNGSDATVTYTPTVTSSTNGAYKIGEINGTSIYGKDTDTHQSLANYIQKSSTSGLVKNDGTIDTSAYLTEHQSLKTINNQSIIGTGNITIQGGSGGSVVGTGSFSIDNNGHLIVELPDGVDNPYFINNNGHLVYDTSNAYNSGLIE